MYSANKSILISQTIMSIVNIGHTLLFDELFNVSEFLSVDKAFMTPRALY